MSVRKSVVCLSCQYHRQRLRRVSFPFSTVSTSPSCPAPPFFCLSISPSTYWHLSPVLSFCQHLLPSPPSLSHLSFLPLLSVRYSPPIPVLTSPYLPPPADTFLPFCLCIITHSVLLLLCLTSLPPPTPYHLTLSLPFHLSVHLLTPLPHFVFASTLPPFFSLSALPFFFSLTSLTPPTPHHFSLLTL